MKNCGHRSLKGFRSVLLHGGMAAFVLSAQAQSTLPGSANPDTFNQDVLPTGGLPGENQTVSSLDMGWMESTQMNLMRAGLGTSVSDGPKGLVGEDPTAEVALKPGQTSPIVRFKAPQVVNRFVFFNFLGSGTVTVSGALTDAGAPAWKVLAQQVAFNGPGPVSIPLSAAEVRMVRLEFNTPQGASIASVSLFGEMRMSDFVTQIETPGNSQMPKTQINPNDELDPTKESINVAFNQWGARMIYVSSGDTTPETLRFQNDYNPATVFQFAPGDPKPTEILRLPQVIPLKRVAMLMEAPVGRIDVYLLRDLPDDISKLTYDGNGKPVGEKVPEAQARAAFEKLFKEKSPKASAFTKKGPNRLELGFLPADCRYMLISFTPGATSGGAVSPTVFIPRANSISSIVSNLMWSPVAQSEGINLSVSEIAAFGFLTVDDLITLPTDYMPTGLTTALPPAAAAMVPPNPADDLPEDTNPPGPPGPPTPPPPPPITP